MPPGPVHERFIVRLVPVIEEAGRLYEPDVDGGTDEQLVALVLVHEINDD